ncbi:FkbM family methyltransferase [Mycolicibacterium sp. SCSIO 43805]|uniref:FkbM family methyltransferase n=1 Tax=Mycolicibacterium sp. SCSIO 43805 TaxID=3378074 RepID=UPI003AB5275A
MRRRDAYLSAKKVIKSTAQSLNIGITSYQHLERLRLAEHSQGDIKFLQALYPPGEIKEDSLRDLHNCLTFLPESQSQYRQDIFALSRLGFKSGGYFVEFGATNGVMLSNTYLLEKRFGWSGILAEPAASWHKELHKNRSAHIETRCVWSDSDSALPFLEVDHAGLSTLKRYTNSDLHHESRFTGREYAVQTISMSDLLRKFNAPSLIDFLSIDTEGSEFEILSNFDFESYKFQVVVVEHNYTPMREKIHSLLSGHGYRRVFESISFNDDWYVHSAV